MMMMRYDDDDGNAYACDENGVKLAFDSAIVIVIPKHV